LSARAVVAIVVGVVVVIALLVLLSRVARGRRLEGHREQAAELRSEAEDRGVSRGARARVGRRAGRAWQAGRG
jgi:hypothetical protein